MRKILSILLVLSMICSVGYTQTSRAILYGYISDDSVRPVRIDKQTRSLMTIDYEHHEIHSGSHYYVAGYDLDVDANEDIVFITHAPDTTKWTHMRFDLEATGATTLNVYEDCTVDIDGTQATPINSDRNSSKTATLIVSMDSTVQQAGTLIYSEAFGVTANPARRSTAGLSAQNEIILKQNSKYVWYISSDSADNVISYIGFWYEHTNKD